MERCFHRLSRALGKSVLHPHPTPKPSTLYPLLTAWKVIWRNKTDRIPLTSVWGSKERAGRREGENTWDIREVKWIAPLCLRQYAEIKFSSKHNLLLLSDGALQHLEKKNTPLICLCHNHPTELNLKDSTVITLWCDFNILKWFSWPIFIRVCTHTHTQVWELD